MKINELIEKRAKLVADARELRDRASSNGVVDAETEAKFDAIMADVDAIGAQIAKEERLAKIEGELRTSNGSIARNLNGETADKKDNAFRHYLRTGELRATTGYNVGTEAEGGALVPTEFVNTLVEALAQVNVIRQIANVLPPMDSNAVIPSFVPAGSATWLAEEGSYVKAAHTGFAKNTFGAHKVGTIIAVSEEQLQDSAMDIEAFIAKEFARQIGEAEETAFVTGDGTGKPTGVTVTATKAKDTASATAITAEEIMDLFHSVKPQYRNKASFLMNDSTALALRKLKAVTDGQYLWQPGLQAGTPDRILGRPVIYSAAMPEIEAGKASVLFGDFSYYTVVDRTEVGVQRLNELYAAAGQIGFKMFKRTDGKLLLAEAVKKLVQKAS